MVYAKNKLSEITLIVRDLEEKISAYIAESDDLLTAWPAMELGDALVDLGNCLKSRTQRIVVPSSGWMPEMATLADQQVARVAHWTGTRPVRQGLAFISACGTPCYPFYGRDRANKIMRHTTCIDCKHMVDQP
ncbi:MULTISPECIES: hypothetical protein [Actinomycetes]|uniref:hypothetical protein n=1 Tax=Actinomycetes TaxID=1760 RepID=UPI0001DEE81A|nr:MULTISPECIES: hypothetical protein [Actinomycetes]EFL09491.1 predicted protein [Streptomyces sp. AA4]